MSCIKSRFLFYIFHLSFHQESALARLRDCTDTLYIFLFLSSLRRVSAIPHHIAWLRLLALKSAANSSRLIIDLFLADQASVQYSTSWRPSNSDVDANVIRSDSKIEKVAERISEDPFSSSLVRVLCRGSTKSQ